MIVRGLTDSLRNGSKRRNRRLCKHYQSPDLNPNELDDFKQALLAKKLLKKKKTIKTKSLPTKC